MINGFEHPQEFFHDYFNYVGDTESTTAYHRWAAISTSAALLGRRIVFPFGHSNIYPNMYCLLVGNPAARKGAALKPASNALRAIEFAKLAPQRVSPERFLIEMYTLNNKETLEVEDLLDITIENLNGHNTGEIYVISDEFGDFIKVGNTDFCRLLTNLWDNLPFYEHPKIHGKSVYVHEPTVNIIAATTPQDIALTLPSALVGTGFLSRFILVHGEPTGRFITVPKKPTLAATNTIATRFKDLQTLEGTVTWASGDAFALYDRIYRNRTGLLEDSRFQHYNNRRHVHLLKICMVYAAMDGTLEITEDHVLAANTLLYVTEQRMPKALGQFGRARNAEVENDIVDILKESPKLLSLKELWKKVSHNIEKYDNFLTIVKKLEQTERVKHVEFKGQRGYAAFHNTQNAWDTDLIDQERWLTPEERIV